MTQGDLFEAGRKGRDEGMRAASDHAEDVNPGWNDRAYDLLKRFLRQHNGPFMAEEVRSFAAMEDFPLPPHARAWAGIMVRAKCNGLIKKIGVGQVTNPKAHMAFASKWEKAA